MARTRRPQILRALGHHAFGASLLATTALVLVPFTASAQADQGETPTAPPPAEGAASEDTPAPAGDAPAATSEETVEEQGDQDLGGEEGADSAPDQQEPPPPTDEAAAAVEHFHGEALHAHVDGELDHHHHGGRLTHDHVDANDWHHHHGETVTHDHEGTERVHHHHGDDDEEGHDHKAADEEHDHLAETFCPPGIPCWTEGGFAIWPQARLIAGYEFVQPDATALFVGQNDGFLLEQARVGFEGTWRNRLTFRVIYDAVTALPSDDVNEVVQNVAGGIRDAFLMYQPVTPLKLWLGQMYMPSDAESQISRADMNFTSRSVMSGGVRAGRGYEEEGLGVIRETGFIVGHDDYVPFSIGPNAIGFDYRVAVANGNGNNVFGNDNKLPAVYARGGARYGDYLKFGMGATYNPRTRGDRPNLFLETESRGFADLTFDMFGFRAVASGIFQWTSFDSLLPLADPNRVQSAYGVAAWLSVEDPFGFDTFGVRPAVRVSYYEPNSAFDDDQLFETTFAIRYIPPTGLPLALLFDVTLLFEPGPASQRQIDNHRATALVVFDL